MKSDIINGRKQWNIIHKNDITLHGSDIVALDITRQSSLWRYKIAKWKKNKINVVPITAILLYRIRYRQFIISTRVTRRGWRLFETRHPVHYGQIPIRFVLVLRPVANCGSFPRNKFVEIKSASPIMAVPAQIPRQETQCGGTIAQ